MDVPDFVAELMPFERRDVQVDGVRMSTVDDGPRDADETLVFLHGNPAWSLLWRNLMAPAREAGHRVVAPDMVGLGMSEKPVSPAYHGLERHIDNLGQVVETLGLDDVTLVMHDWGGPVGMGLAVEHPERVKRLVVANTVAFPPSRQRSLSIWHKLMSNPVGGFLGRELNVVAHAAFRFGVNEKLAPNVRRAYLWPFEDEGARIAAARLVEMVPDGPDHPTARTLMRMAEAYPDLTDTPMLVLWADGDPVMLPKFTRKWAETFPEADVRHVSETAGHFWQEDDPGPFLRAILAFVAEEKKGS